MRNASALTSPSPGDSNNNGLPIRLMVVDDSITARTIYSRIIERETDLELSAVAGTAEDALALLREVQVDVILLDLEMPGMGGLEALPKMIADARGAQVMVISSLTIAGAEHTLNALALGAADTLPKPPPGKFDQDYRNGLVEKIRGLGVAARRAMRTKQPQRPPPIAVRPGSKNKAQVLAIGASTGGIHALGRLFAGLPPRIHIPILITQHLPESFMEVFARQLKIVSGREAIVAENGTVLVPDQILIAPGHSHMRVVAKGKQHIVQLDDAPAVSSCRPSVDPMFQSIASVFGSHALGVVLSGMGRDGSIGAQEIVNAGGTVLAQDQATCAVWGMPGAVAMAGLASSVLPPEQLASRIVASRDGV